MANRFFKTASITLLGSLLLCTFHGAAPAPAVAAEPAREAPAPPGKREKSWLEFKDVFSFPINVAHVPGTPEQLGAAMMAGWSRGLNLPRHRTLVHIIGDSYPELEELRIDLSDSVLKPNNETVKWQRTPIRQPALNIARFQFLGTPMVAADSPFNVEISASDVRLDLEKDRKGRPYLIVGDARDGHIELEITHRDMEKLLLETARDEVWRYGVRIDRADVHLMPLGDRSLWVDLRVRTRVGLVPAGLRLRGRFDIDDQLNGTLWHLSVEGDSALGPLISRLIRPSIRKYNGTTRPLVDFAADDVRLSDVRIIVEDTIRIAASFGNGGIAEADEDAATTASASAGVNVK